MCGFLFQIDGREKLNRERFEKTLSNISWRGPDASDIIYDPCGNALLGHCRLSVVDPKPRSNQPMRSSCGRYLILFNGEIYNHIYLRKKLSLHCSTGSDTETVLAGYKKIGEDIFSMLDGMFAIVIYDNKASEWVAARDAFGIKPLYFSKHGEKVLLSSEASAIAEILSLPPSEESILEWAYVRRPVPGYSYFDGVEEVLPGTSINSKGFNFRHFKLEPDESEFDQEKFEEILIQSVQQHEMSDVTNVSLLSGGLDSAVIAGISSIEKCYTVGLEHNNEFEGAQETATQIGKSLDFVKVKEEELVETWRKLVRLRNEPLGVPNEGLIYSVCSQMEKDEKVVLTGEGADEILFGYDRIFRWARGADSLISPESFIERYGYGEGPIPSRLIEYVSSCQVGKSSIDFVEDFFLNFHLPGLLRRMDFASMAASKEARVPFVNKKLISYMYRRPSADRIDDRSSKIPLRRLAAKMDLFGALSRRKVGFSAEIRREGTSTYSHFRSIVMGELGWC